ncbi:hypothetical protein LJR098_001093 [Rhizobium sp. LjRoot98]|uniref:hypothetical protein n=1 Tax=Rhizobium sp. LjRoot98 TaxID=3342345 RepID=UPI003ED16740
MTISAHLIEKGKFKATVTLPDEPNEADLIIALSGNESDRAAYECGRIGMWEVLYVPSQPDLRLVIGAAPYNDAAVKTRLSCGLTSDQAENLVKGIDWMRGMFGGN